MVITQKHKKNKKAGKYLLSFFIAGTIIVLLGGYFIYNLHSKIFAPNTKIENKESASFYVPTGSTYEEVVGLLKISGHIENLENFEWLAKIKKYPENIKPGHYLLREGMNNNELVNMLRGGMQTPIKLTFSNVRTKNELAGIVSRQIEADSTALLTALNDSSLLAEYDFTPVTVYAMIIPNTYEIWWNTSSEKFIARMHKEYESFWSSEKREIADSLDMTPIDVTTLASIVEEETIREDEKSKVAGLYINRLKKGIKLQADPTIKHVINDFTINRVLSRDLAIDTPYNTYIHKGLPPGPIRFASVSSINAVLNYEDHDYIYMCAKDDFSGYHNFAKTLRQHNINAAKYRQALKIKKIWR